jgi:hypothetical protein
MSFTALIMMSWQIAGKQRIFQENKFWTPLRSLSTKRQVFPHCSLAMAPGLLFTMKTQNN